MRASVPHDASQSPTERAAAAANDVIYDDDDRISPTASHYCSRSRGRMVNFILLLWALVGLIGRVHGKCSLAPIADNERSIAYACIHGDLSDLDELSGETEWIEFSVSRFHEIPDDAFRRFPKLRRLSFYNCHVNVIRPDAFRGLPRLDWLIFHGTRLHAARAAWFRHLLSLRKLILDRCGLVHVEPDVFRMLPRVETLGLRDNDLDCLPVEQLSHMRTLRAVRIDGNPWLCECRMRLDHFFRERSIVQEERCKPPPGTHQSTLQCMMQIDIPILFPIITVEQIGGYEESRHSNRFQTSALTSLDRLPDRSTWIEITGLRIERVPAYTFFRFGNSLRILELRDCSIDVIDPGAFAGLHQLQRLVLIGNRLPAVAAHWFGDLVALQQLVIARNAIERIEPGALQPLADSLRHLDMRYNRLQCLSPDELTYLRRLERLDAVGNPWNCECRRNLHRALMDRHIGFEISGGRCYENGNEVGEPTDGDDRGQQWPIDRVTTPTTGVGQVRWTSFEETLLEKNITVIRPVTVAPTIQRPPPPSHRGICVPDRTDRSRQVYTCTGITSLKELDTVPRSAHTVRIILSNLKTIPTQAFARFDGYMSRLELRDCGIEKIEYRAFADLYSLQYLSLHSNQLESITREALEGLTNLRQLDVSRNHIYRFTNDAFDMVPQLRSLDISENYMNCIGVEQMARKMPHLIALRVSGNPWSCLCGTKLANYLDTRGIRYDRDSLLSMNEDCYSTGIPVTPTAVAISKSTTTEPPSIPLYEEPSTGSCTIHQDAAGMRHRCIGGNLSKLKSLHREAVAIEFYDGNLPRLPAGTLYNFGKLKELIIRNCGLRTIEPGAFRGLDSLERLAIQHNPLTSVEQGWFNIERLERLDLRGNSIRYIAPGAFRQLPKLVYLNLEGNDLQCIFSSDLSDMPDLHVVEFAGNPLKWRCRMDLEQFLEMRKIKFVKVENSCEGKKIMRNLLYENRTSEPLECPPGCSAATEIEQAKCLTFFVAFATLVAMRMH